MSSWLAFHMIGMYPNAGQPYYLITSPLVAKTVIHLENGAQFTIAARGLSDENTHIRSASLNGQPFSQAWIAHGDVVKGGTLVLEMGPSPSDWGSTIVPPAYK